MTDYGEWITSPAESDEGELIMVSQRVDNERFRRNPKFDIRVDITWPYEQADGNGMPCEELSAQMETVQERLEEAFHKDPIAVLTGVCTGAGERNWTFYTLSNNIFGRKLNEQLADMPVLPLTIVCEKDPRWAAYDEMGEIFPDRSIPQ